MVKQRGLTLLEMLISLVILSSVMMLASSSYSHYVVGFNNRGEKISSQFLELKNSSLWQTQLSLSTFYFLKPEGKLEYSPWFFGEKNEVAWVASSSITEPGMSTSAWLGVIDDKMTYCERPLSNMLITALKVDSDAICSHYKSAISNVEGLTIEYYGWDNLYDRYQTQSDVQANTMLAKPKWFDKYSGVEKRLIPLWIKVSVKEFNQASTDELLVYWIQIKDEDTSKLDYFFGTSSG